MTLRKRDLFVIYEPGMMREVISSKDFSCAWRTRMLFFFFYLKSLFHLMHLLICRLSAPVPIRPKQSLAPKTPANQYSKSDTHTIFRAQSKQSQRAHARPLERFVCRETSACLSVDTCGSAHGKQPAENHRYHHHKNFKQYSCQMNSSLLFRGFWW